MTKTYDIQTVDMLESLREQAKMVRVQESVPEDEKEIFEKARSDLEFKVRVINSALDKIKAEHKFYQMRRMAGG